MDGHFEKFHEFVRRRLAPKTKQPPVSNMAAFVASIILDLKQFLTPPFKSNFGLRTP